MDLPAGYEKLLRILPRYLSGFIWALAIAAIASLNVTPADFEAWLSKRASLLSHVNIPDIAVGFLVVVFGILFPLAVAVILGPLSLAIATVILRRWYSKRRPWRATPAQYVAAVERMQELLGTEPAQASGVYVLYAFLHQSGSALYDDLASERRDNHMKATCALPVGLLSGCIVYFIVGQDSMAVVFGAVAAMIVFLATVHNAAVSAREWEQDVVLAFLLATTRRAT